MRTLISVLLLVLSSCGGPRGKVEPPPTETVKCTCADCKCEIGKPCQCVDCKCEPCKGKPDAKPPVEGGGDHGGGGCNGGHC